jgi:Chitobiase/beta-hexosaminidase C-terminal domain
MMKLLLGTILLLLVGTGCGGYGSGMGTTPAPVPAIAPTGGAYSTPLTVTISDSLANAVIYVTTDGSAPTLSSPIYRGPMTLSQAGQVTVRAIAAAGGYATSPVASANFTLQ